MRLPDFFSVQNREGEVLYVMIEMWPGERCALHIQSRTAEHLKTILGINYQQAQRRLYDEGYKSIP